MKDISLIIKGFCRDFLRYHHLLHYWMFCVCEMGAVLDESQTADGLAPPDVPSVHQAAFENWMLAPAASGVFLLCSFVLLFPA